MLCLLWVWFHQTKRDYLGRVEQATQEGDQVRQRSGRVACQNNFTSELGIVCAVCVSAFVEHGWAGGAAAAVVVVVKSRVSFFVDERAASGLVTVAVRWNKRMAIEGVCLSRVVMKRISLVIVRVFPCMLACLWYSTYMFYAFISQDVFGWLSHFEPHMLNLTRMG